MNIDSVFNQPIGPFETTQETSGVSSLSLNSSAWSLQIDSLNLLSVTILSNEEEALVRLVEELNTPPIHYENLKKNYVFAYLNSFNDLEREAYLFDFFSHFDPSHNILSLDSLSFEDKDRLWEGLVRYFCDHYLNFQANSQTLTSLLALFNDHTKTKSKLTEKQLDQAFDQGLDFLLDYSRPTGRIIEAKVLFMTYLARLISQLESIDIEPNKEHLEENYKSIDGLFEELYFYLLSMPYPVSLEAESDSLFHHIKKAAKLQKGKNLQKKFVDQLIMFLRKQSPAHLSEAAEEKLRENLLKYDFFGNS